MFHSERDEVGNVVVTMSYEDAKDLLKEIPQPYNGITLEHMTKLDNFRACIYLLLSLD